MGQPTLRITINETEDATLLTLEGRVAGPWAAELGRVWEEKASQLAQTKLSIDISNVIFADVDGTRILREIYLHSHPKVVANTLWTKHLAREISGETERSN